MFFCAEEVSPIVGGREHGSDGFEMDYNILYIYICIYTYIYIYHRNKCLADCCFNPFPHSKVF